MADWACVNGRFSPLEQATISINDRGLLFADSVYEVLLAEGTRLLAGARHFARLQRSLSALGIAAELPQVRAWVAETLRQSGCATALIYVQVTRGSAPRQHLPPPGLAPNVIVTVRAWQATEPATRRHGVRVITVPESRWARRDIKTTNLLPNFLAKQQAAAAGAYEALFVEADGTVNEGASANVAAVLEGVIVTPPQSPRILPGVSRDIVVELARRAGLRVEERTLTLDELLRAEEVLLTGTTTEVQGVTQIDDAAVGTGAVGPVTWQLYEAYRAAAAELLEPA
ncbi:MAG: aminotransferase class IV [Planctomycetaceae bacterium]|nr:aminotransferase class IV [Planctomycetaceae bacterium]